MQCPLGHRPRECSEAHASQKRRRIHHRTLQTTGPLKFQWQSAILVTTSPTDVACGATMNFFGGNFSQTCLCGKGETTVFTCPTCAVGTYQDEEGTSACKNCAAGTYQDTTRMAACLECPKGRFQTQGGAEDCDACPTGWDSTETGSVNCVLTPTTAAPTTAAPI